MIAKGGLDGGSALGIATLIAAERLGKESVAAARDAMTARGLVPGAPVWLEEQRVLDIPFEGAAREARAALDGLLHATDVFVQEDESARRKRLLVADMDSTMITVECIDELADFAGLKPEVAAITERAMRGQLDFEAALRARVALLEGLSEAVLDECRRERVRAMPGAAVLVATMRAHGARTLLVSGGFTAFAEPVGEELGFDEVVANVLAVRDGLLTGKVLRPIVDAAVKAEMLRDSARKLGLGRADIMAVGDGANDLPMIEEAGLGVAYRAKPVLSAAADAHVEHGDLTALLWAQGYKRSEWASG
jgi:phosphoserine phosphatase